MDRQPNMAQTISFVAQSTFEELDAKRNEVEKMEIGSTNLHIDAIIYLNCKIPSQLNQFYADSLKLSVFLFTRFVRFFHKRSKVDIGQLSGQARLYLFLM